MAYCYFHRGDYKNALQLYEKLYNQKAEVKNLAVNIACCYFYLGVWVQCYKFDFFMESSSLI